MISFIINKNRIMKIKIKINIKIQTNINIKKLNKIDLNE